MLNVSVLCHLNNELIYFLLSAFTYYISGEVCFFDKFLHYMVFVVSYHFVLGLPVLRKSDLTLFPASSIEMFLSGSCSSSLIVCANSTICLSMSLLESFFRQFLSCSFPSLSFAISSSFLLDILDQYGCLTFNIFCESFHLKCVKFVSVSS